MGCQEFRFLSSVTGCHLNDCGAGDLRDSCLLAIELGANGIFQCVQLWGSAGARNWYDCFCSRHHGLMSWNCANCYPQTSQYFTVLTQYFNSTSMFMVLLLVWNEGFLENISPWKNELLSSSSSSNETYQKGITSFTGWRRRWVHSAYN